MGRSLRFKPEQLLTKAKSGKKPAPAGNPGAAGASTLKELLASPKKIREKQMNKTEETFAALLEKAQADGEILRWEFEPVSLRVGPNTRYNPDFLIVLKPDRHWQLVEIKGHLRDDAAVKFKDCAEKYPEFSFLMIKKKKGKPREWEVIYNLPSKLRKTETGVEEILP